MKRGPVFVFGDVHGQHERMRALLREAGLLDRADHWSGRAAALWFIGDFFDRGPDGVGAVETVMRLQGEAAAAGGRVGALLGNHEPLILAAARFPRALTSNRVWTFRDAWERNGGLARDLAALTPEHAAWLTALPAMARVGERLLIHADSLLYRDYGATIPEVNAAIRALLLRDDLVAWDRLLVRFSDREAFNERNPRRAANVTQLLETFGGCQIIHGHTPIARVTGFAPETIDGPYRYADGRCVNVDGGMYLGGPGFVYRLTVVE